MFHAFSSAASSAALSRRMLNSLHYLIAGMEWAYVFSRRCTLWTAAFELINATLLLRRQVLVRAWKTLWCWRKCEVWWWHHVLAALSKLRGHPTTNLIGGFKTYSSLRCRTDDGRNIVHKNRLLGSSNKSYLPPSLHGIVWPFSSTTSRTFHPYLRNRQFYEHRIGGGGASLEQGSIPCSSIIPIEPARNLPKQKRS